MSDFLRVAIGFVVFYFESSGEILSRNDYFKKYGDFNVYSRFYFSK